MLALTDDDVASSAATAIMAKPASPSAGSAATASAVSPLSITSCTVRVPKTPMETSTYSTVVMPAPGTSPGAGSGPGWAGRLR